MVCGSYRRGKPNCGDVDILITHPDGHSHENLFRPILNRLKETGEFGLSENKYDIIPELYRLM